MPRAPAGASTKEPNMNPGKKNLAKDLKGRKLDAKRAEQVRGGGMAKPQATMRKKMTKRGG